MAITTVIIANARGHWVVVLKDGIEMATRQGPYHTQRIAEAMRVQVQDYYDDDFRVLQRPMKRIKPSE